MPNKVDRKDLKEIIRWDVKNWGKALDFWDAHFALQPGMRVLALGEREGGLSYYFASEDCLVESSDYVDFPETTRDFHAEKGVADRINYHKIDMRHIDFPEDCFDIVVFKSVLGALGNKSDQDKAIHEIVRVLKKGGALLFAENATGSPFHKFMRKRYVRWGNRWRYISSEDIEGWSSHFSKSHVKTFGSTAVFGRSEKQRERMGSLDTVLSPITPKNWRYIYFGVMIK